MGTPSAPEWHFSLSTVLAISSKKNPQNLMVSGDWLIKEVQEELKKVGITAITELQAQQESDTGTNWTIAVYSMPNILKTSLGLKIGTPWFDYRRDRWGEHLAKLWKALNDEFTIADHDACPTSIYIRSGPWRLEWVTALAKSIIHYGEALDEAFPAIAAAVYGNRWNDLLKGTGKREIFQMIDQKSGRMEDLTRLIDGRRGPGQDLESDRWPRWMFHELDSPGLRSFGAVKYGNFVTPKDIFHLQRFVRLTVAFVGAALRNANALRPDDEHAWEGYFSFIHDGLKSIGTAEEDCKRLLSTIPRP